MNIRTFSIGGIHPEENKLTHEVATKVAALPKQAIFPLSQHIGAPAKPVVQKGDKEKLERSLPRQEVSFQHLFILLSVVLFSK